MWYSNITVLLWSQTICSPIHQNRLGLAVNTNSALSTFFILSVWLQNDEWWSFIQMMGMLRMKITLPFSKYWWRAQTRDKSGASSSWPSSSSPRAGMEISQNHHLRSPFMNRFFNVHPKSDDKSEMEGEGLKQWVYTACFPWPRKLYLCPVKLAMTSQVLHSDF